MHNESIAKTLSVAIGVCVVCSVLVSSAAVGLRERQKANKLRDQMENILIAAGMSEDELDKSNEELAKFFNKKIDVAVADLEGGKLLADVDPTTIDEIEALKDPTKSQTIPAEKDIAGIKRRANRRRIYLMRDEANNLKRIILPVRGKGLWSTMYGYLTLEGDGKTVTGLDFYEHGETPGLGAEVADNASWKAQWKGKVVFDEEGKPVIEVVKSGRVNANNAQHQVDGISGATITCRGVTHLLHYWLSENGYGPILDELREKKR